MHAFEVPKNIQITNPVDGKPLENVTFNRWFIETVLNDKRVGFTPAKLARVMTMMGKVSAATVGSKVEFEDADYDACKAIVSEPEIAIGGPAICAQLLPFAEAFLAAEKKG
jgi:hypothetical protein